MDNRSKQSMLDQAKQWVYDAGQLIRDMMEGPYQINTKKDHKDLVTEVDEATEQFLLNKIKTIYPDHQVMGEEGVGEDVESLEGTVWIIDPIDGTMNFVHQRRFFAISVGIYHEGIGEIGLIYDVMGDVMYEAARGQGAYKNRRRLQPLDQTKTLEDALIGLNNVWAMPNRRLKETTIHQLIAKAKGTRSYGSAALEFAFIAEGIIDAYVTMRLAPWDVAAGMILVNEVGGMTTQIDGSPLDLLQKNTVICANQAIHSELLTYIEPK
ncbi:inositol monophosphatase family protein [Alkalibacillus salilacus]|uniref:inositol-phosphate phosphatase n=1 Tax=Alkalibacillus salilacus TaxID=284582 RepID=A0ABT9VGL9_9BACI|nr:inositol monophosphatase family protein [Alkalibacillus salilacus]MDQ0160098.1 myo-inositol-1(or 4)-monophosphatase [Alkalibacillus salilacus]